MANIKDDIVILTLQNDFTKTLERFGGEIVKILDVQELIMDVNEAIYYRGRFDLVIKNVLGMDMQFIPLLLRVNNLRAITEYNGDISVKYFSESEVIDWLESNNIL